MWGASMEPVYALWAEKHWILQMSNFHWDSFVTSHCLHKEGSQQCRQAYWTDQFVAHASGEMHACTSFSLLHHIQCVYASFPEKYYTGIVHRANKRQEVTGSKLIEWLLLKACWPLYIKNLKDYNFDVCLQMVTSKKMGWTSLHHHKYTRKNCVKTVKSVRSNKQLQ